MAGAIMDVNGDLLEYRHLMKREEYRNIWGKSYGNELGRLSQGIGYNIKGTYTIVFTTKQNITFERQRDITYGQIVCDYREIKEEPNRVRLVVGGEKIKIPIDCGTPKSDLFTVKLLLNSVVSKNGAKLFTHDIKNFYLNTPMERFEYMRLKMEDIPENVIEKCELKDKE